MKKLLIISLLTIPFLFGACHQKAQTDAEQTATEQNSDASGNSSLNNLPEVEGKIVEENLSGNVITLTSSEFIERICDINNPKGYAYKGHTPCLVDFYAGWCGPCMKLKPIIEKLAKEYKGEFIVYSVNVDRAQDVCEAFGIESIPTLLFFSRTKQPTKIVGYVSEQELKTAINDFIAQ